MLDLNSLPKYNSSSMRYFDENEKHITRIFDYDVLLLIFDGILRFNEDGKSIELVKNEYYIQRAGLFQEGIIPSSMPKYFYIHFNGEFTLGSSNSIPLRGKFEPEILKKYTDKLNSAELSYNSSAVAKTCLFYNILEAISRQTCDKESEPIAEYISANYTKPIKIQDIAAALSYSEDHIIRAFGKLHNTTPHKYITALRMQLAKELLITTDRSVWRIATDCGYSDMSVFYRCFSSYYGCTPLDLRNQIKP